MELLQLDRSINFGVVVVSLIRVLVYAAAWHAWHLWLWLRLLCAFEMSTWWLRGYLTSKPISANSCCRLVVCYGTKVSHTVRSAQRTIHQ